MEIKDYVRTIPNFPEEGIMYRDITSVVQNPDGLQMAISSMQRELEELQFDLIVGAESRGFVFGTPLAFNLKKGFVLARKPGKLPCATISQEYVLEYGISSIEIHKDAIRPGQRVVIVDDLMATGGTIEAIVKLVEKLGGIVVKVLFLLELEGLNGRDRLKGYDVTSIVSYEGH